MNTDILKHAFYKAVFQLKKHSPEILTALGIGGVVTGTVMACKATTKLEKTMESHKKELDDIHTNPNPDEKEHRKEVTKAYLKTAWDLTKLYAPAVIVEGASIGCLLGSHKIMRNRNAALAAAYTTVSNAFESYKKRVADKIGEEAEKEIRYDIRTEEIDEEYEDTKGKKKTRKKTVKTMDGREKSPYSRFYADGCDGWSKDPGANVITLRSKQAELNKRLQIRGYLFLNEVYEFLGIPLIREGQYLGWFYDPNDPTLHNKVDFGIYDCHDILKCNFVNGFENTVLLDFNIDGNIVDRFNVNNEEAILDYCGGR